MKLSPLEIVVGVVAVWLLLGQRMHSSSPPPPNPNSSQQQQHADFTATFLDGLHKAADWASNKQNQDTIANLGAAGVNIASQISEDVQ